MFLTRNRKTGTTLIEVMITTSCFALVLMVLFQVVKVGTDAWKQVEAKGSAQTMLRKIENYLLDDMRRTGASTVRRAKTTDGQTVLWFLSAVPPDSTAEDFKREGDSPKWQSNIIYYCTPLAEKWHMERFGFKCDKTLCPHKVLVRKVVVWPGSTDAPAPTAQSLDATATDESGVMYYVREPEAFNLSGELHEPDKVYTKGCKKVMTLADCIQGFDVHFPDGKDVYEYTEGTGALRGIDIAIRAFRFDEASRHMAINEETLKNSVGEGTMKYTTDNKYEIAGGRYTMQYNLRVVPNN